MSADIKRKAIALVGEVREDELACRILEACMGIQRPEGCTAQQALAQAGEAADMARAGARAAVAYMSECFAKGVRPS